MRLIDADALANYANNQIVGITANDIMRFPTVEAEPVKHARWLRTNRILPVYTCSECNNVVGCDFKFCPYCSAKMDGGADE